MNNAKELNHGSYVELLREMGPQERLRKAFDLSDFARRLFVHGLRKRFPDLNGRDFQKLLMERLEKCHNSKY